MQPDVHLCLAPDRGAPRAARTAVVDGLGLDDGLAEDAALLVSEAVTNSVLHAGLAPDAQIEVTAWRTADRLRVEVTDPGHGMSSPSPADPDREGGFGLGIIAAVAKRWGMLTNGHTRIWFELVA